MAERKGTPLLSCGLGKPCEEQLNKREGLFHKGGSQPAAGWPGGERRESPQSGN